MRRGCERPHLGALLREVRYLGGGLGGSHDGEGERPQQRPQQRYGGPVAGPVSQALEEQLEDATRALRASEDARRELAADYRHVLRKLWEANAGMARRER